MLRAHLLGNMRRCSVPHRTAQELIPWAISIVFYITLSLDYYDIKVLFFFIINSRYRISSETLSMHIISYLLDLLIICSRRCVNCSGFVLISF